MSGLISDIAIVVAVIFAILAVAASASAYLESAKRLRIAREQYDASRKMLTRTVDAISEWQAARAGQRKMRCLDVFDKSTPRLRCTRPLGHDGEHHHSMLRWES